MTSIGSHNLLQGKRGIIFGALDERSLAWKTALRCKAEGASFVLTNTRQALALGKTEELGKAVGSEVIACDATDTDDIRRLLEQSMSLLGGKLDFVLHSIAMSQNMRRHRAYDDLNYNYLQTTLDISAVSLHKILQECMKADALEEYASVVTLTYIASERFLSEYGDMSDAKALLESIVRNMGGIYGRKRHVRVNAISQSPVRTRAEQQYHEVDYFHTYAGQMAPLGLASAEDCAGLCAMLFSDYTRGVTMQTIYNDGGFSQTVMSHDFIEFFRKGMENYHLTETDEIQQDNED